MEKNKNNVYPQSCENRIHPHNGYELDRCLNKTGQVGYAFRVPILGNAFGFRNCR